ncbi:DNA polymerase III subunit delta [Rhodobacteraceae bacterium THAF1]|uniref:DNA polymerase III subunit delta n=1 Tax=Palleronia sp. THAF1 TaxID=2587842 RepID=UPI000F41876D|nr:DNA polymerase III subunit delta [Palleronia sp. THAF1]QFU09932.1 DNA polymerase III subunit delta [Palleronia sp. THAF1]VDC17165.1 DNA polymerase III subunit delta [Rhodobacteraceae bacterium THAF1]
MKLNARDANAWIAKPPPDRPGTLIYGEDAMRVALKRQDLVANLAGPGADEEMRLTRIAAADLRKEKSLLSDALKAQGFFPGARVALVEDVTAHNADQIVAALSDWKPGDAHIVVTGGQLKPTNAIRKTFEKHPSAVAIAIYDQPPDRAEIEGWIKDAGLAPDRDAMGALMEIAQAVGPGDLRRMIDKLALYKHNDPAPLTPDDIAACAPASTEAELDDVLNAAADGRTGQIGPILARLEAQGAQPVALVIAATRHFRTLHAAAADPGGPASGIGKLRPPVFGPRRDAMLRQAQRYGMHRLEDALRLLTDTDLTLRSTARAPQMALMERTLIRLAMMGRR